MQTDMNMELISTAGCPYSQRTKIVLAAKGIDARIREIDLKMPPADFLARSPLAKVPVLVHGDESLVESTVINEYLDEVIPAMPLRPNDPALRARMRFLVALEDTHVVPAFYRLVTAQDEHSIARAIERYRDALDQFESLALQNGTPFMLGDEPTLADITAVTHLQRHYLLSGFRNIEPLGDRPLGRWLKRMNALAPVSAVSPSAEVMHVDLLPYFEGTANGVTAKEIALANGTTV